MNASMIWTFLAGLGIFLFGMHLLEDALRNLVGRTFKLFLKKHTGNKAEAIASGAFITAILQSSSVVSLMVLAFIGAGIMNMRNGLAVVLGSNLGTTVSSWVVVLLGFEFDIELFSLPIVAFSSIGFALFRENKKMKNIFIFGIGFGFLFFGLDYMKNAFEILVLNFDFASYGDYNRFFFVFIGFIITALIQSSSVTMIITLSALHAGAIPFAAAAAIVVGAEVGTSMKTMLSAFGSMPEKKRVALGNIIFNLIISFLGVLFLGGLVKLVMFLVGNENPLIALVLFQTIMNLIGLALFYPFLERFGTWLEGRYSNENIHSVFYIAKVSPKVPEAAMEALEKEVFLFVSRVSVLNMDAFHIQDSLIDNSVYNDYVKENPRNNNDFSLNYENIKDAEGEILAFCARMRKENMNDEDINRVDNLIAVLRNAMYSAKSMKDIRHNRQDFRNSADDIKYEHYKMFQEQLRKFYIDVNRISGYHDNSICFEELVVLFQKTKNDYEEIFKLVYEEIEKNHLSERDISTLLNVNRELFSARKALMNAFKFLLLNKNQVKDFESLPFHVS